MKPVIENELDFLTVNSSLLAINKYTIFLAKNKPVYIKIAQGMCVYFYFYVVKFIDKSLNGCCNRLL